MNSRQEQHVEQRAERQISRRKSQRHAEARAEQEISRRRSRQHAEQRAVRQTSRVFKIIKMYIRIDK